MNKSHKIKEIKKKISVKIANELKEINERIK